MIILESSKSLCDMLAAVKKPLDDILILSFPHSKRDRKQTQSREFRTIMLSKPPYLSYNQSEEIPEALAAITLNEVDDTDIYVDSGATSHVANDLGKFKFIRHYFSCDKMYVGNGKGLNITHI